MLCYILTTGQCNLKCGYCGGSFSQEVVPYEVKYDIDDLARFLKGVRDLAIAFYGGEPLLNPSWIKAVMDNVDADHYVIQTNGLLMDKLEDDYWRRMGTVLLSIDGDKTVTDHYRGEGVYDAVVNAASTLRSMKFRGDLVARMTVSRMSDVYRDVKHLLSTGLFDHVHWQIDAIWGPEWRGFDQWLRRSYEPGLRSLMREWVDEAISGNVAGIVPFKSIALALLSGKRLGAPPCGAGWGSLSVNTSGEVLVCPIAIDVSWSRLGSIRSSSYKDLLRNALIGEPCTNCPFYGLCGGRCLYAHHEKLWGVDGFNALCRVTMDMIKLLKGSMSIIEDKIRSGALKVSQFEYPPYMNSIEIIP